VNERRRLIEESRSDFVRTVLEASRADSPEIGACDRALAAFGVGVAALVTTTTAAAASTATTSVAAPLTGPMGSVGSMGPAAAKGGALLFLKWTGAVFVASAVAVGSIRYAAQPSVSPPSRPAVANSLGTNSLGTNSLGTSAEGKAVAARARVEPEPPIAQPDPVPAISNVGGAESRNVAQPSLGGPPRSPTSDPLTTMHGASLGREPRAPETTDVATVTPQLEALAAIRGTLASGDATRALELIDAFTTKYPSSPMSEEASVLRIDALALAGRAAEASSLSTSFLRRYPTSAYGERVRARLQSP
jgi:hypothetical protein